MLTNILFLILGIISSFAVSAGLFALLTTINLIPRLIDKTHTSSHINLFENVIVIGATIGNIITVYHPNLGVYSPINKIVLLVVGIFFGIHVGLLALALAESLNVTVVFLRRLHLHSLIWLIILATAFGKCIGSFIYFFL